VADNGPGIDPAVHERLFEPFFTTKPVGKGTGLGLSTSWSIVAEHGGTIDAHDRDGGGTCMIVHLPMRPPEKP
jgi:two-component system sensor histidine kinase HupT/HoxJ